MKPRKQKPISNVSLDKVSLDDIYEFMESGSMDKAPVEIRDYVLLLDKVRAMHLRIDQYGSPEPIIRHLMTVEGLSRYKANKIYQEALEYFYCDNIVSKAAWSNIYAGKMDQLINFAMLTMKDVGDAAKIGKIILDAWKMRGGDQPDIEDVDDSIYKAPIKIYTADAHALGMPRADRNKLKELIDKVPDLTEKEKQRIYQEADIIDFKMFPNEQEDPRKS